MIYASFNVLDGLFIIAALAFFAYAIITLWLFDHD